MPSLNDVSILEEQRGIREEEEEEEEEEDTMEDQFNVLVNSSI